MEDGLTIKCRGQKITCQIIKRNFNVNSSFMYSIHGKTLRYRIIAYFT